MSIILEKDYLDDNIKQRINTEIVNCNKISNNIKTKQYNFLYVLFWIGIKLKDYGYNDKQIEKLITNISVKIKLSADRWEEAYKFTLKQIKKI
jgi:hypothetical protein